MWEIDLFHLRHVFLWKMFSKTYLQCPIKSVFVFYSCIYIILLILSTVIKLSFTKHFPQTAEEKLKIIQLLYQNNFKALCNDNCYLREQKNTDIQIKNNCDSTNESSWNLSSYPWLRRSDSSSSWFSNLLQDGK